MRDYIVVAVVILTLAGIGTGQAASIGGLITDSTGGPVSGAMVTIRDESDPALSWSTATGVDGRYTIEAPLGVEDASPSSFALLQNYPNPFNPGTTIPFTLDRSGEVTLSIYAITGQRVGTLVEGWHDAGYHTVVWNGRDDAGKKVSAGVYLCRLRAGNRQSLIRMLLLDGGSSGSGGQPTAPSRKPAVATGLYEVTVTGTGLFPQVLPHGVIRDGAPLDITVARETDRVQLVLVEDAGDSVAAVISDTQGESLALIAEKPTTGRIGRITGLVYTSADSLSLTLWFNADGLPETIIADGLTLRLANWTYCTVDAVSRSSTGTVTQARPVFIDVNRCAALIEKLPVLTGPAGTASERIATALPVALESARIGVSALIDAFTANEFALSIPTLARFGAGPLSPAVAGGIFTPSSDFITASLGSTAGNGIGGARLASVRDCPRLHDLAPGFSTTRIARDAASAADRHDADAAFFEALPATYTITGCVKGAIGIANAEITRARGNRITAYTNITGSFSFSFVPPGSYTLWPERGEFTFAPDSLDVTVTDADITLPTIVPTLPIGKSRILLSDGSAIYALSLAGGVIETIIPPPQPVIEWETDAPFVSDGVWSPDGKKIAYTGRTDVYDLSSNIWVANQDGNYPVRITNDLRADYQPTWSPDGKRIAFWVADGNQTDIYIINTDGTGYTYLDTGGHYEREPGWSPDGSRIVFSSSRGGNGVCNIYTINADGTDLKQLTFSSAARNRNPDWSPDGSRIVFSSNRDGNYEIYVMNADGSNPTRLTNGEGSNIVPSWSPDGEYLVFSEIRLGNLYIITNTGDYPIQISDREITRKPDWGW